MWELPFWRTHLFRGSYVTRRSPLLECNFLPSVGLSLRRLLRLLGCYLRECVLRLNRFFHFLLFCFLLQNGLRLLRKCNLFNLNYYTIILFVRLSCWFYLLAFLSFKNNHLLGRIVIGTSFACFGIVVLDFILVTCLDNT